MGLHFKHGVADSEHDRSAEVCLPVQLANRDHGGLLFWGHEHLLRADVAGQEGVFALLGVLKVPIRRHEE